MDKLLLPGYNRDGKKCRLLFVTYQLIEMEAFSLKPSEN